MEKSTIRQQFIEQIGVPVDEHNVTVAGLETSYVTAGRGKPLLLLHGSLECGALSWYPILPALARNFRVIAPDCPGYGESAKPATTYDATFYTTWLHGFLHTLQLPRLPLIGSSQGGAIALHYALRYPPQVTQLVLVNSAGLVSQWSASVFGFLLRSGLLKLLPLRLLERWLEDYLLVNRAHLDERFALLKKYEKAVSATPEVQQCGHWGRSMRITRALAAADLRRIVQPTLLLWGEQDSLFPPKVAWVAAQAIPRAHFQLIPDAGHAPQLESPQRFLRGLHTFLAPS
ncbi:MAG: alpha/beta hydrolase [Caldilineaceae bacterium]